MTCRQQTLSIDDGRIRFLLQENLQRWESLGGLPSNLHWKTMGKPMEKSRNYERLAMVIYLVVEPTHLKNMLIKMGSSSPSFGVKIQSVWNRLPVMFTGDMAKQPLFVGILNIQQDVSRFCKTLYYFMFLFVGCSKLFLGSTGLVYLRFHLYNHKHQPFMSVNIPLDPMGISIIIATWRIFPGLLVSVVINPHLEAMKRPF